MLPIEIDLQKLKVPVKRETPVVINGQYAQDLFVIAMTQGKYSGTYLEIGCGWPNGGGTNTLCLEKYFEWSGISIDSGRDFDLSSSHDSRSLKEDWAAHRPGATFLQEDALLLDYSKFPSYFDYLQVDIDPPVQSFAVLEKITKHIKFSVITFEHDYVMGSRGTDGTQQEFKNNGNHLVRDRSRDLLHDLGYTMIVPNIGFSEDWWVDAALISSEVIDSYKVKNMHSINQWKNILLQNEPR